VVKQKGEEWEECTNEILQTHVASAKLCILLHFLPCLFLVLIVWLTGWPHCTKLQTMALNVMRQYTLYDLFVPPIPNGTTDGTAVLVPNLFLFVHKPNKLNHDSTVIPTG
jgi:hypothetical protein